MGITAPIGSDKDIVLAPEGNHVARCIRVIHTGSREEEYMGQKKLLNKVSIFFELSNERHVFKEENGPENFVVSKEYTLSLYERATLRHHIDSWRGKALTEEEAKIFDITNLLGAPCLVNIIQKLSRNNKQYVDIQNITPLPGGMPKPVPVNELFWFSVDEFDQSKFDQLTDWMKKRVQESIEYQQMINGDDDSTTQQAPPPESPKMEDSGKIETEDDLPF